MARILLTTPSRREYSIEGVTFRALRSTRWNVRSTFGAEPRQNVSSYVEFGLSKKNLSSYPDVLAYRCWRVGCKCLRFRDRRSKACAPLEGAFSVVVRRSLCVCAP